jgi:diguanylate cyclase (GGDEF)-like protein
MTLFRPPSPVARRIASSHRRRIERLISTGCSPEPTALAVGRAWRDKTTRDLLRRLLTLTQTLTGNLNSSETYRVVIDVVQEATGADRVSLQLLDETQRSLTLVAGIGLPNLAPLGVPVKLNEGIAGWVLEHRESLLLIGTTHPNPTVQSLLRAMPDHSALCVPLTYKGTLLGVLNATKMDARRPFDAMDLQFLEILAGQAATAIAHARLHALTVQRATTDGLTGLLSHRAFQERLATELERASRSQEECALLAIDLDHFKQVNDTHGHAAGDRMLRLFAHEALLASTRSYDFAGRVGGDEFGLILPHTTVDQAQLVGERIRQAVLKLDYAAHGLPAGIISCSIGMAHFPSDGLAREDLQIVADQGLYAAKYHGRNQTQRGAAGAVMFERDPARLQQLLDGATHGVIEALAAAVDARDPYTAGHSRRVAEYAIALARALGHGDAFCGELHLAALFHDVGKIGISDGVLRKTGPLTLDEYAQMQEHPKIGADHLLRAVPFLQAQLPAIRHHHERWDGRGYPHALKGEAIPYQARILAVVDAYDAMTSNRVYRQALLPDDVLRICASGAGIQWDPMLMATWLDLCRDQPQTLAA